MKESKPNGGNTANGNAARGGTGGPSFFSGLLRGILQNLPLLIAGVLLLLIGALFDVLPVRILSYSLFIAYLLCCSFQALYGLSSKSLLRANEPAEDEKKDAAKPAGSGSDKYDRKDGEAGGDTNDRKDGEAGGAREGGLPPRGEG